MTSNSKVTIEIDREVAEFLDKTGEDAQGILLMVIGMGGSREHLEKAVGGIENCPCCGHVTGIERWTT